MATTVPMDTPLPANSAVDTPDRQSGPGTPHPAYLRMKARWDKCRALMAGTQAVRDGREAYLGRLDNESNESYEFRRTLCAVFNGFQRTVKACVGMLLEKDPELGDDNPPAIVALWEDVDLGGTHGAVFAKLQATDAMIDGHVGGLVDFPRVEDPSKVSLDDERRANLRPYWVRYPAADILKVVRGKVNGRRVIILLVLQETSEELVGDFGVREIVRYRVYRHSATAGVTWELWRKDDSGNGATKETGPHRMQGTTRIPFSICAAGERLGDFETRPALDNLADLNLEHHQIKTNIRNLEMLAMVPTQVRMGAPATPNPATGALEYPPIELGPRRTIEAPAIQGVSKPVYWHSPDVTVLDPSSRSLADVKADMGAAGLAFIAPDKRAAETAEAKRLDASAQNATLSTVSRALQDHLEELLGFTAEFLKEKGGSITLNRDFEQTVMDAGMVTALSTAAANGNLDVETFLDLLERGRILAEGTDKAKIIRNILTAGAQGSRDRGDGDAGDGEGGGGDA